MGLPCASPSFIMVSTIAVIISVAIAVDSGVVVAVVVVIVVSPPTVNVIFLLHFKHVLSARSKKNILYNNNKHF